MVAQPLTYTSPRLTASPAAILHSDCLAVLREMPDCSVDAIVTDPPYGLGEVKDITKLLMAWMNGEDGKEYANKKGFMSKDWDVVPSPLVWKECFRVLRPGGYLLAFAGTRTWDLMSISIRLAGFEDRDTIAHNGPSALQWLYGSGFPKSTAIDKQIDKHFKAEREVIGINEDVKRRACKNNFEQFSSINPSQNGINSPKFAEHAGDITAPATPEAKKWQGWGSALKPSWEPVLMFRKPLSEPTIAQNVLVHGTGGLNIDKCRIGMTENDRFVVDNRSGCDDGQRDGIYHNGVGKRAEGELFKSHTQGRWPSNTLFSHTLYCRQTGVKRVRGNTPVGHKGNSTINDYGKYNHRSEVTHGTEETIDAWECDPSCPVRILGEQSGVRHKTGAPNSIGKPYAENNQVYGKIQSGAIGPQYYDTGTAARYFAQFSPSPDELEVPYYGLQSQYCFLCYLLCSEKHDIMTANQEDITSCNSIVTTVEKSSKLKGQSGNIVAVNVQERLPLENEDKSQRPFIPVGNVGSNGWNTQATIESTAQQSAWGLPSEKLVQLVKCAANLCDSCVTVIVQGLVHLKYKIDALSLPGLDSIPEINAHILHQSLVQYVESLENTGTTPTIASLSILFGSVQDAIRLNTSRERNDITCELDQIVPFIYSSKASRAERNRGCEGLPEQESQSTRWSGTGMPLRQDGSERKMPIKQNTHPTVKSLSLMKYLCRLVGVPGGVILDPFMGSGSTGVAALQEGFSFIGIEQSEEYCTIARSRIAHAMQEAGIAEVQGDGEWICSDDCPVKILGEQSGISKSNVGNRGKSWSSTGTNEGWKRPAHEKYQSGVRGHEDTGTASRFFAQFAPDGLWSGIEEKEATHGDD